MEKEKTEIKGTFKLMTQSRKQLNFQEHKMSLLVRERECMCLRKADWESFNVFMRVYMCVYF